MKIFGCLKRAILWNSNLNLPDVELEEGKIMFIYIDIDRMLYISIKYLSVIDKINL